jgi:hypothetical protein
MAERLFVVDLNLNGNKATNFRVEDYATDPTSGNFAGRLIHNTTGTDRLKMHDGTEFRTFAYTSELTSGTVTSVDLSAPDIFTVSNNPVTNSGTLTLTLATQTANYVWAGPTTGSSAAPSFRALVAGDIPSLTASKISDFNEAAQDAAASMITTATHTNVSVSYDDEAGTLAFTAAATYSDENARDAVAGLITGSTHSGISVAYTDDGANAGTLVFSNTGVTGIQGTSGEITITPEGAASSGFQTGNITVGLPTNVVVAGDLKIGGDLDIVGAINSFSTSTISVEDNKFLLNSNVTGTPSVDAGIEVERGDYTNASLYWNETANGWYVGTPGDSSDGPAVAALSLAGHSHSTGDITGLQEYVEDTVATAFTDSGTIDFTYTDNSGSAGTISAAVILASSNPYLSTTSGLAVDVSALETKLTTDGYTKKYSTTFGNGSLQTFTITHSLNTRSVTVQVYESATPYSQVEVEVLHSTADTITINTNSVPTTGQYTVVVVG